MIDGVEILNQIEGNDSLAVLTALLIILLAIGVVLTIVNWSEINKGKVYLIITVFLALALYKLINSSCWYIRYEVKIDDSVSINEFLNKYEILEQRGEIYTVREKD